MSHRVKRSNVCIKFNNVSILRSNACVYVNTSTYRCVFMLLYVCICVYTYQINLDTPSRNIIVYAAPVAAWARLKVTCRIHCLEISLSWDSLAVPTLLRRRHGHILSSSLSPCPPSRVALSEGRRIWRLHTCSCERHVVWGVILCCCKGMFMVMLCLCWKSRVALGHEGSLWSAVWIRGVFTWLSISMLHL